MKKTMIWLLSAVLMMSMITGAFAQDYSATARGFGGDVNVTLTIEGAELTNVQVVGEKETVGIGTNAIDQLPSAMVEANSIAVDAVAGATVTSNAIFEAAKQALSLSGVTLEAKEVVKEEVVFTDAEADVVVVGGGIAGMTAAMDLADAGKRVILLEKTATTGGAAMTSHSAIWAIGSELTKDLYDFTADEIYEFFCKKAGPVYSKDVFYALANDSYDTMHWLIDRGVKFSQTDIQQCNPSADDRFWFMTTENYGEGLMNFMREAMSERDIDVRMNTRAVSLIQEENGEISGVVAQYENGTYNIRAQKVILATGGIGQNEELMAKYVQGAENIAINYTWSGADGDGHLMGVEAGGRLIGEGSMGSCTALFDMDIIGFGMPLTVNKDGVKVAKENEHYTELYTIILEQENGEIYCIYPADMEKYTIDGNLETMENHARNGELYRGETIEELAQKMGIDVETFVATVNKHNQDYAAGAGDELGTPADQMIPVQEGPYFGYVRQTSSIGTITGLVVDTKMRVLDANDQPIQNLYAIGEMMYGNWFNGGYPMSGTGLGGCVSSGRIAAADVLESIH